MDGAGCPFPHSATVKDRGGGGDEAGARRRRRRGRWRRRRRGRGGEPRARRRRRHRQQLVDGGDDVGDLLVEPVVVRRVVVLAVLVLRDLLLVPLEPLVQALDVALHHVRLHPDDERPPFLEVVGVNEAAAVGHGAHGDAAQRGDLDLLGVEDDRRAAAVRSVAKSRGGGGGRGRVEVGESIPSMTTSNCARRCRRAARRRPFSSLRSQCQQRGALHPPDASAPLCRPCARRRAFRFSSRDHVRDDRAHLLLPLTSTRVTWGRGAGIASASAVCTHVSCGFSIAPATPAATRQMSVREIGHLVEGATARERTERREHARDFRRRQ